MNKNNRPPDKISSFPDHLLLGAILLLCLAYRLFYFCFLHPGMLLYNSDSVTYFSAVAVFEGHVDLYRTPLYTYVIRFFEYLSRDHFIRNLVFFQQAVSFLSVIPFYSVARSLVKNRPIVIIATLFFGCWPYLLDQNVNINPEGLCVAGSTFMFFLFARYIGQPSRYTAAALGIFSFLLIMLKPTYLIILGLILIFFAGRFIVFRRERKILYWGLLGWLIAVGGVLGYCALNGRHSGQFVLSNVFLNNSLAHVSYSGAYLDGGDKEFIDLIDANRHKGFYVAPFILNNDYIDNYKRCYKKFPPYLPPTGDMLFLSGIPDTDNYSPDRLRQFVKKSKQSMVYFKYMLNRTMDVVLAYGFLFMMLLLESLALIHLFIKSRTIAWTEAVCVLFVLGQFFSIIIGGVDHLDRLLIPSYPVLIQIAASLAGFLISPLSGIGPMLKRRRPL